ncbi:MAG TPA: alpha/beta hydrolase fold domain-containing protein [Fimbriimonadaceae bacterium]|nr:alpha/beta hydrolase fold domain-containing protein [Fimbriimonadaceae bacterium]
MQAKLDLFYPALDGTDLGFDLYLPESENPPLVVCIHGGGWISGDRKDYADVGIALADHGFAAACPTYRLAPLHPFPTPVDDIRAFVQFAKAESQLGWDPTRLATLGNSAGGHLAAMAGLLEQEVKAVVDICGISDVTDPRAQHFPISWAFLEQFMQIPYEGHDETFRAASPLHQVPVSPPPFLLIHGEQDDIVPVAQSTSLANELKRKGGDVELHLLPHDGHSFSYESWEHITSLFVRFLKERL